MILSKSSKKFFTGVISSVPEKSRSMEVFLFLVESDGGIAAIKRTVTPSRVKKFGNGTYLLETNSVEVYVMNLSCFGNSVFFITKRFKRNLFGTFIEVTSDGGIEVKLKFEMPDPKIKASDEMMVYVCKKRLIVYENRQKMNMLVIV